MTTPLDTLARLRARSEEAGRFVLPLERTWADKAQAAYETLNRAEMVLADPDDPDSAKRIADAQAEVDRVVAEAGDQVVIFRFRRMGRARYDALVNSNPTTEAQKAEDASKPFSERRAFNMVTFAPQLLHAVLIDPKLEYDQLVQMLDGDENSDEVLLSKGESDMLLNSALMAALSRPRTLPPALVLP